LRQRLHPLRRLLPAAVRRRLSDWLRRRGFKPDAHYRIRIEYPDLRFKCASLEAAS